MVARGALRRVIALVAAVALLPATPRAVSAHPLHTSLAQVAYDPSTRTVEISLRVFVDDFASAVIRGKPAAPDAPIVVPADSAMYRYVVQRFTIFDRAGRAMSLRWCGARRAGEQLFVCLRASPVASPAGGRMRNTLLRELFADQVNIVQASYGNHRRTLLFTSAAVKALP